MQRSKSELYKSRLLAQVSSSIDGMLQHFMEVMPASYFETNDEQTILQHLSAILLANTSGNQEQIALANQDATQQTFIHFGSYPGLLSNILNQLPHDKSIQLARAYTALDNELVIDIFDFDGHTSVNNERMMEIRSDKLAALESSKAKDALTFSLPALEKFVTRANTFYLQRFDIQTLVDHSKLVTKVQGSLDAISQITEVPDTSDLYYLAYAVGQIESTNLFTRVAHYLCALGCDIREAYVENFDLDTPEQTALVVLQIKLNISNSTSKETELLDTLSRDLNRLPYMDQSVLDLSFSNSDWPLALAETLIAICHVADQVLAVDSAVNLSRNSILKVALDNNSIALLICNAFCEKFRPNGLTKSEELLTQADKSINNLVAENKDALVLHHLVAIVRATLKSNVHFSARYALALRLSPDIFHSETRQKTAFGIFYIFGKAFDGFHVRFQDIARGGVRIVQPSNIEQYALEATRLFDEAYDLAFAQQLKNKDIPEGGSKGVILVKPQANKLRCGKSFVDGLLDLILDNEQLASNRVDHYPTKELIFLGPDENVTDDLIEWIFARASQRQYILPNAFMSSKPNAGINHKIYGVTSEGVKVFLHEGLKSIGINPATDKFSIKITGGPDGDVAGNLIKILQRDYGERAKILGIADGSGCVEDPAGLNLNELVRLANENLPVSSFDIDKLSDSGHRHSINEPGGVEARNTLHNRLETDVFIPAGGRPATINEKNYQNFLLPNGETSSKLIVEGANLFLTPQAREKLTEHGVLIVKDSSANKCGVICSSFEIAAGMMLDEKAFLDIKDIFVKEVIEKLQELALLEAKTLFREHYFHPETGLATLSMHLSSEIIKITDTLAQLIEDNKINKEGFNEELMKEFFPESLLKKAGEKPLSKLPLSYFVRAMASILASRIIYHEGIHYLESLHDERLTEHLVSYLQQEEKTGLLIRQLESSDLAGKKNIIEILKRGATGTALRWQG